MWEVKNGTPFSAAGYFVRDRDGFEHWTVAVRARFGLEPSCLPRVVDQQSVRIAPEYADESALELAAEADLSPFRPRPDIILRGEAHPSLDGGYARLLTLKIGGTEKRVLAFGPRRARRLRGKWRVERQTFAAFSLSWKRSLGGRDVLGSDGSEAATHPINPIGAGWSPRMTAAPDGIEFDLPQLERPDDLLHPGQPPPSPIGFGAIQPAWEPRAQRAGTYDKAWRTGRAPMAPVDFAEAFHQAASDDQVYDGELRGGEPVELDGFLPDRQLGFRLPQVLLDARTRLGAGIVDSRFRLIGLDIDATASTLDMIWNISIPCPGGDHRACPTGLAGRPLRARQWNELRRPPGPRRPGHR